MAYWRYIKPLDKEAQALLLLTNSLLSYEEWKMAIVGRSIFEVLKVGLVIKYGPSVDWLEWVEGNETA